MKNRKISNNDYIKRKINQSLQKNTILNAKIPTKISKKIFLESHNHDFKRKKESTFLTTIKSKIIRIDFPQAGSFNAGILDLGNKILCVYRSNEYEFIACFLNYEYKVIDDFYYKFKNIHIPLNVDLISVPASLSSL